MATTNQRTVQKGRRSDRASVVRVNKPPVGDGIAHLLPHTSEGVYNNPPLAHTLVSLIGCVVEVQLTGGEVYEGVLRAISPSMKISLNVAHVKGQSATMDSVYDRKEVKFADVVTISAKTGTNPQLDIFKTDTEISGRTNGPQSRELQPFTDFTDDDTSSMGIMGHTGDDGWTAEEMFAVNQDKFQVSSTYDEELPQYTTPLLRDGENYRQREMEAMQLANEIESKTTFSRQGVDDTGTEEDRWSAVLREPGRLQDKVSGDVKENGSHTVTSVTPPTQTPPTSTPPLIAPPPHTSAPSPFPPLHHTETIAPPTPSQLPGNNQTDSSDDVSLTDSNNKTNEGVAPEISHERDFEVHSSIGETTTTTEDHSTSAAEAAEQSPASQPSSSDIEVKADESVGSSQPDPGETEKDSAIKIKNFKLDPTAKEFVMAGTPPSSSYLPPLPSSATPTGASASPAPAQGSPSGLHYTPNTRSHPHTPRGTRYPGNHSPRVRAHTPTSAYSHPVFTSPDPMAAASSSYVLSQQPTSLLRPSLVQQGFSQFANPLIAGGMAAIPQIITANPHMPVIAATAGAGQQQFSLGGVVQQPPLFAQPSQPIYTAQGVVMPAGGPMYIPAVGGVPLSPIHQQMAAAAAVGMSQMNPAAVGQTLVGTTTASAMPRAGHYQMQQGAGK